MHLYFVRGDRSKLHQVLINLLNNALKFTRRGGIRLEVVSVEGIPAELEKTLVRFNRSG